MGLTCTARDEDHVRGVVSCPACVRDAVWDEMLRAAGVSLAIELNHTLLQGTVVDGIPPQPAPVTRDIARMTLEAAGVDKLVEAAVQWFYAEANDGFFDEESDEVLLATIADLIPVTPQPVLLQGGKGE